MEQTFETIFGVEHNVSVAQMCARAFVVFIYGIVMLRLSGRRTFAQLSAVDMVVSFIVGSSLSRAISGTAPFFGTLASVAVLIVLHVAVAFAVAKSKTLSKIFEGSPVVIASEGILDQKKRQSEMISDYDVEEALRTRGVNGLGEIHKVARLTVEPSGKLSVVKAH